MPFNFNNYVKLWAFAQFVGLEILVGGMISQRWHVHLGALVAILGFVISAGAFAYVTYKDGIESLIPMPHLLMAIGYAAIAFGYIGVKGWQGDAFVYVGSGVAMAGFAFNLLYR